MVEAEEERDEPINFLLTQSKKDVLLPDEREDVIKRLRKEMKIAAEQLDFETAMRLRDEVNKIKK